MAYLRASYLHPLFGSDIYLKPEIGALSFIAGVAPAAIGMGVQVLGVLGVLAVVSGRASIRPALAAAAPFVSALIFMTVPIVLNPFGKNFTMMLPLYVVLWVGLLVFVGSLLSHWSERPLARTSMFVAMGFVSVIGMMGAAAAMAYSSDKALEAEIRSDRAALHALAESVVDSGASTILTPLTHTGIPAILIYEVTRVAEQKGIRVPRLLNTNWNPEGGAEARAVARQAMLDSFDAVIVVPGGPEKFYFLGTYQSHVYDLTEEVVTAPDTPFVLAAEIRAGPTTSPFVYFLAGPDEMTIRLYVKPKSG